MKILSAGEIKRKSHISHFPKRAVKFAVNREIFRILYDLFHKYTHNHTSESWRNEINFLPLISSVRRIQNLFVLRAELFNQEEFQDGKQGSNGSTSSKKLRSGKRFKSALKTRWRDGMERDSTKVSKSSEDEGKLGCGKSGFRGKFSKVNVRDRMTSLSFASSVLKMELYNLPNSLVGVLPGLE